MNRLLLSLAAVSFTAALLTSVDAAPWQPLDQRKSVLEERINQGVRSGTLTRSEAQRLRGDFSALQVLEAEYRRSRGGLSANERDELDRRYDTLSRRIRINKSDYEVRSTAKWVPLIERRARIHDRIQMGVKRGLLTRDESSRLMNEFNSLMYLEQQYRRSRDEFTMEERADLERRFVQLSRRVDAERGDRQTRW